MRYAFERVMPSSAAARERLPRWRSSALFRPWTSPEEYGGVLRRAGGADGRRLVLFFDEFQELASARRPYGDPDAVTKRMRVHFETTFSKRI